MSPNRRIFMNVIATYGRSLYALVCGLFTSRWVLMSLGEVDFGLYGVVGGLAAFMQFFNNLLGTAVVRFYGVSVGAANISKSREQALDECRRWFSIAFALYVVIPAILIAIGYPIGEWAIRCFLTIPESRVQPCLWVWRFTCIASLIWMFNVPFQAMYTAKQEIAELTIYGFATTTINVCFLYYMVTHPADWLARYSLGMCLIGIIPQIIIGIRAVIKYPECRFRRTYVLDFTRIKQLGVYAGSRFWTALCGIFSSHGQNILVNKYMGPVLNASMTVGAQVSSHSSTLSSSISGAFWPAIANAAGEQDINKVKSLCFRVCRLSTLMVLIFVIPLSLEIDNVLRLWLKNPPAFASAICVATLFATICERITEGYWMAVMGIGKRVAYYSWVVGWAGMSGFIMAFVLLGLGTGLWGICAAIALSNVVMICFRLYLGKTIIGLSSVHWLRKVLFPMCIVALCTTIVGLPSRLFMDATFIRICITTLCCLVAFGSSSWAFILTIEEKALLLVRASTIVGKFRCGIDR